jgi:KDO2-lipid IV(A) lauroyltransferase
MYRLTKFIFRIIYFSLNLFPEPFVKVFAKGMAGLIYLLGIRKKVVMNNLSHAFPELQEKEKVKIAKKCYANFSVMFLSFLTLPGWKEKDYLERIEIKTPEVLREYRANKRGKILLTGHFNSWELYLAYYSIFFDSYAVIKRQNSPAANDFAVEIREKLGERVLYAKESLEKGVPLLQQGKALLIGGDQDARHHGIFVDFFGRPASTYVGAAVFARRANADVYFTVIPPIGKKKYGLYIEKLFDADEGFDENFVENLIQKYMDVLEKYVRLYPDQYFWLHKRWKTRPPEESSE